MNFLSPLFLIGAATAAVPIVLHLLKREPEPRVLFSAVRLLKRAPVEHTEKHRLRELLLLALRVAALVLLALAFARPFFTSTRAAAGASASIVALDCSCSMPVLRMRTRGCLVLGHHTPKRTTRSVIRQTRPGVTRQRYRARTARGG